MPEARDKKPKERPNKKHARGIIEQFVERADSAVDHDHSYHESPMKQQILLYNLINVKMNQLDKAVDKDEDLNIHDITKFHKDDKAELSSLQVANREARNARLQVNKRITRKQ